MSLRFIYGASGSGKSYFCLNDIKNKFNKNDKNNIILLVPEQFSFQSEKAVIEEIGATGIINVKVLSFKRLAYEVFNEVGGITREYMNGSGKCMLIYKIMDDLKEELNVFNRAADKEGFADSISTIITEFKNYNVKSDILLNMSNDVDDELLRNKIRDIAIIYENFNRELYKKYIDSDDDLTVLYNKIHEVNFLKDSEIWIDEFNSFTPQQYSVIEKLLKICKRINISLCIDVKNKDKLNSDVFMPVERTENKLLKIAMENNIKIDKPIILNKTPYPRFKESEELEHLERNFYCYPAKSYKKETQNIILFKAKNTYSEIENVAKNILKLCREEGYRFKDIAILTRNLDDYENIVRAVFSEHNIPYFIDKKKDIDNNPLIILIQSSIEIFNKKWSYESVFRYLKSGLINISKERLDLLENYVLAYGIRGKSKWLKTWGLEHEENLKESEKEILKIINETREEVVAPLMNISKKVKGKKTVRQICEAVFDFLCQLNIPENIEKIIQKFKEEGKQDLVMEYSGIWNLVIDLLDQIVEVMGDEIIALDKFIKILAIGFSQNKMGLIPPSLDQILVSTADRVKSHDIKALFIIGVNDGVFPSINNDEGLFTDSDRMIMNDLGIELAKDTRTQAFEEQFLIYSTLTIPCNYLRISYPISDFEGKALRPSIIISRLKAIYTNIKEESDVIKEEEWITSPLATFNKLVSNVRKNIDGKNDDDTWVQVYHWFSGDEKWRERLKTVFKGFEYSNNVKNISKEKISKLYGKKPKVSVSRLEKYKECPFAYYVQYGLSAKERKIFKYNAPDIGTFLHKVIDEFSETVDKNNFKWAELSKEWCANTISEIVDKKIEDTPESILNSSERFKYFSSRLKRVLIKTIWIIVEGMKRSKFEPLGYEMSFDEGGDFPPIEIELSGGEKVKLIGRIDRVDKLIKESGVFYRVIDYKSGNKDFNLTDAYYGLQIQLLTYLDAILQNAENRYEKPVLPAGVLYFKIDDPMIKISKDKDEKNIEEAIMKEFKMKGLVLNNTEIVKDMDESINGSSLLIPVSLKKDETLGKTSSVASEEQFEILRNHVKDNLIKTCEDMLMGDIKIKPYKKKDKDACTFCMYSAICQFDPKIKDNVYRNIENKKDKEIWGMLEKERELEEGDNNGQC